MTILMQPEHPLYARCLCLDAVLAAEHVIDFLQVVGAFGDRVGATFGLVGFLEVRFLAEVTHLVIISTSLP